MTKSITAGSSTGLFTQDDMQNKTVFRQTLTPFSPHISLDQGKDLSVSATYDLPALKLAVLFVPLWRV